LFLYGHFCPEIDKFKKSEGQNDIDSIKKNKMKKKSFISLFLITIYLVSCGPSHKITSTWVNPKFDRNKKYEKVFILVLNQDQSTKNILETDMTRAAEAKGFAVVKSSEYFTPAFGREELPSKDVIMARVQQMKCDAILTVRLVDAQKEQRYVPGMNNMMMNPMMMGPGMGMGMGMRPGMGFGGFHGGMGMMYQPGYMVTDKTYFYEATIFDGTSEDMIWMAQSEETNKPSSFSKFSRQYSKLLADRIRTDLMRK